MRQLLSPRLEFSHRLGGAITEGARANRETRAPQEKLKWAA